MADVEIVKKIGDKSSSSNTKTNTFNFIPEIFTDEFLTSNSVLFMMIDAVELKSTDKYANYLSEAASMISKFDVDNIAEAAKNIDVSQSIVDGVTEAGKAGAAVIDSAANGKLIEDASKAAMSSLENLAVKISDLNSEAENGAQSEEKMIRATWTLPLPNELKSSISHSYKEDTLNPLDKVLKSRAFGATGVVSEGLNAASNKTGIAGKIALGAAAKATSTDKIRSMIESGANLAKRHNVTLDNNIVNTYAGTGTRKFSFTYTIMPQSQEHAINITAAILNIKKYMSGVRQSEIVKQSNIFRIRFMEALKGSESVRSSFIEELMFVDGVDFNLTDITVTYGADGSMMMFNDGMPKFLLIKISLEERKPLYRLDTK